MKLLFTLFLILHITGGAIGLITGTINILRKKGGKSHVLVGKLFIYGMSVAGISALVLSIIRPNYFLFIVGIFTLYMISTGTRYIHKKMLGLEQKPALIDWIITITMLFVGISFITLGIILLIKSNNFGIVFIVFGALSLRFVRSDFKNYKGNSPIKNYWLLAHFQRMTGAYIASLTAFLVVNIKYLPFDIPATIFWLLPTAILFPVIIRWNRKYAVKN